MDRLRHVILLLGVTFSIMGIGYAVWGYTHAFKPSPIPTAVLSETTVSTNTTPSPTTTVIVPDTMPESQTTTSTTSSTSTTSTTVSVQVFSKPTHLTIKQIGVDDELIPIELGPEGEFVAEPFTVAWYSGSVWPGQPGPMLVAAHVAWKSKGADRFAQLSELRPGDEFQLTNKLGEIFIYVVTDLYQIDKEEEFSDFMLETVYGNSDEHVLWLNTCGGDLLPTGHFDSNIFVRATVLEEGS